MCNRYKILVSSCSTFLFFSVYAHVEVLGQSTQNSPMTQYDEPLEYTKDSYAKFFKTVFRDPRYAQEYLAVNFSHVSQGLNHARNNHHPRRWIKGTLDIFSSKLCGIWINPFAFDTCLETLIPTCVQYADSEREKNFILSSWEQMIGLCLSNDFDRLKRDPQGTLRDLVKKQYEFIQANPDQDISIREFQQSIHYFLTQSVRLLGWSPHDQSETWQSVKGLAQRLQVCVDQNLIDLDMLDKLYWILIQQYGRFLEVGGHLLEPSFFEEVYQDLQSHEQGFWLLEERELYITTKLEYLQQALMQAEAASQLVTQGYFQ